MTPEKASQIVLETVNLDAEQFRLGKTKVLVRYVHVQIWTLLVDTGSRVKKSITQ